ncbi:MAG: mandelate racemase/muconate lactonizing enzyme family protein [Myxococcales bacterium]|nr:mandelate racemase/muconate lactonizing enzyme family protein [Myxococcales bacterium]
MRIDDVTLWHVSVPLPAPFFPAWIPGLPQTDNRFTLVRLRTVSGLEGWSAGPAMATERQGMGSLLGPYLLGERADDLESIRQRLREMSYLGWHLGWLEAACWDVIGKARGVPVWQLLGGTGGRVQLYASTGDVKDGRARVVELEKRRSEGFVAAKLRVHKPHLADDLEQIAVVAQAMGAGFKMGIDANQGWRVAVVADAPLWDVERAKAFAHRAGELGYAWLEEPLANDDYAGMAELRRSVAIPIAGAELNHHGLAEIEVMLQKKCLDIYQPDAVFAGGISETWKIVQAVAAGGARYTPHTWTNGIGFAINLALFAASPWRDDTLLEYPISEPGWIPDFRDGLLQTPWQHHRGYLELPTAPGLGFTIDKAQLWRHASQFYRGTKLRVALGAVWDKGLRTAKELGAVRDARLVARQQVLEQRVASGQDLLSPFVGTPVQPHRGWKLEA